MNKLIVYILLLFIPTQLDAQELMKGELKRELLPQPVFPENPHFVDLYWKTWELAWGRVKYQEGVFQSPYMDENLWDDTIWIWDTEFMVLFCRYAPAVFPE